jgi:pyrimidine-nucleoside phosphorylase
MMKVGGLERDLPPARKRLGWLLDDQTAFMKFREIVARQGGDPAVIDHPELLPSARHQLPVASPKRGYVSSIQTEVIGTVAMVLGAGREQIDSQIDPAVGLVLNKKRGDPVEQGDVLAVIHCNNDTPMHHLSKIIQEAYVIKAQRPRRCSLIQGVVTESSAKAVHKNPKS